MSVRRLRIIECDSLGCLANSAEETDLGMLTRSTDEQRQMLRIDGWTKVSGKDYCAECGDPK